MRSKDIVKLNELLIESIERDNNAFSHSVSEMFNDSLRKKFFEECTDKNEGRYVPFKTPKINIAPHDLFEWFKSNVC